MLRTIRAVALMAVLAAPAYAQQQPPENSQLKLVGVLAQNLASALGQVDALQQKLAEDETTIDRLRAESKGRASATGSTPTPVTVTPPAAGHQ